MALCNILQHVNDVPLSTTQGNACRGGRNPFNSLLLRYTIFSVYVSVLRFFFPNHLLSSNTSFTFHHEPAYYWPLHDYCCQLLSLTLFFLIVLFIFVFIPLSFLFHPNTSPPLHLPFSGILVSTCLFTQLWSQASFPKSTVLSCMAGPEYKWQYHLRNWYLCNILHSVTSQNTFTTVRSLSLTSYFFIRLLCNAPTLTCLNLMLEVCLSLYEI